MARSLCNCAILIFGFILFILIKYFYGDFVEEDKMVRTCGA
jgi:hypothetical protein